MNLIVKPSRSYEKRLINTARDVVIYLARELTGESGVGLGKYFGSINGAAITVRYNHISERIRKKPSIEG